MGTPKAEAMQCRSRVQDLPGLRSSGVRQLEGKSFYLDAVRSPSCALLAEAIAHLGGRVESFLNKDVTFVISGRWEVQQNRQSVPEAVGLVKAAEDGSHVSSHRQDAQGSRTATPRSAVFGSRGKTLLEKAIRNIKASRESRVQNSILANAHSWGIKVVHVKRILSPAKHCWESGGCELGLIVRGRLWFSHQMQSTLKKQENAVREGLDVLLRASSQLSHRLMQESSNSRSRDLEKASGKSSSARVVKAGKLKTPYLKIEDCSRKYRPLHAQSVIFPVLNFAGKLSPFEPPAPSTLPEKQDLRRHRANEGTTDPGSCQNRPPALQMQTPSPPRVHRKAPGFCECCQLFFKEEKAHLQSDQHRQFAQERSNYSEVDRLISLMQPGFSEFVPLSHTLTWPPPQVLHKDPPAEEVMVISLESAAVRPASPTEGEAMTPVIADLAPPTTAFPQVSEPWTVPACRTWGGETMVKLPEFTEDVAKLLTSQNSRKRARAYSLNPRSSKKQRTMMSDPAGRCATVPAALHSGSDLRLFPDMRVTLPEPATLPGEAGSADQPAVMEVRPESHLAVGETSRLPTEDDQLLCGACGVSVDSLTLVRCADTQFAVTHSASAVPLGLESSPPVLLGVDSHTLLVPVPPELGSSHRTPPPLKGTATSQAVCPQHPPTPFQFMPLLSPPSPAPKVGSDSGTTPLSHSVSSVCIEAALLPDPSACSPSSSESLDWDYDLLSRPSGPAAGSCCSLDLEVLQRPSIGMQDTGYTSWLCSVLQPPTPPQSLFQSY